MAVRYTCAVNSYMYTAQVYNRLKVHLRTRLVQVWMFKRIYISRTMKILVRYYHTHARVHL